MTDLVSHDVGDSDGVTIERIRWLPSDNYVFSNGCIPTVIADANNLGVQCALRPVSKSRGFLA